MGPAEVDAFLSEQRTCRVATASELGPWLKLVPDKVTSWDSRSLHQAQN